MPILASFGGASVRCFGRGLDQPLAVVPSSAVVPFAVADITTATIPSGWSRYTKFDNKFILGTATNAQVGTTVTATGNVMVSMTTSSNGNHALGSNTSFVGTPAPNAGSFNGYTQNDVRGSHNHQGGYVDVSGAMPNTVSVPFIMTSGEIDVLPANAIVFRSTAPDSISYSQYTPSGNGYFYGGATSAWTNRTGSVNGTGVSTANGAHNHLSTSPSYRMTTQTFGVPSYIVPETSGDHTHPFVVSMNATLKSKHLVAWVSQAEEAIQPGMIIMYDGNLNALPSGWRVCDGQFGTPNMVDYFIGYGSGLAHDAVINASSAVSLGSISELQSVNWSHEHISDTSTTLFYGSGNQYHGTLSVPHGHTVTSSSLTSVITQYMPNCTKIAFIQYKTA
jgi:hypothetical protein